MLGSLRGDGTIWRGRGAALGGQFEAQGDPTHVAAVAMQRTPHTAQLARCLIRPASALLLPLRTPQYTVEVSELIRELAAAGSQALGVQLEPGVEARLLAYARSGARCQGRAVARGGQ